MFYISSFLNYACCVFHQLVSHLLAKAEIFSSVYNTILMNHEQDEYSAPKFYKILKNFYAFHLLIKHTYLPAQINTFLNTTANFSQ